MTSWCIADCNRLLLCNICRGSEKGKGFLGWIWVVCSRFTCWNCGWHSIGRHVGTLCTNRQAVCFKQLVWTLSTCLWSSSQQVTDLFVHLHFTAFSAFFVFQVTYNSNRCTFCSHDFEDVTQHLVRLCLLKFQCNNYHVLRRDSSVS